MKLRLALLLLCIASPAFADSDHATSPARQPATNPFVAVSYSSTNFTNEHTGITLEGARRFGDTSGYLRAALAVGRSDDDHGPHAAVKGAFEEARVGIEIRGSGELVRAFGDIDLGVQADHRSRRISDTVVMTELKSHFVTMPRIGIEMGSRVRVRVALGFVIHAQLSGPDDYESGDLELPSGELDLGLAVGF